MRELCCLLMLQQFSGNEILVSRKPEGSFEYFFVYTDFTFIETTDLLHH